MDLPVTLRLSDKIDDAHLTHGNRRFLKLFKNRKVKRIHEDDIIDFYVENIRYYTHKNEAQWDENKGAWVWKIRPYKKSETRQAALAWFDRNLGNMIRRQLIPNPRIKTQQQ